MTESWVRTQMRPPALMSSCAGSDVAPARDVAMDGALVYLCDRS
jgi:hypothetical protein